MRALDLFCGAGGVSMGLHRAGFDVVGVDIEPQPSWPAHASGCELFIQADAVKDFRRILERLDGYQIDFIWASPPCQHFTAYKRRPNHVGEYPNLIPAVREMLKASGKPYVIENVVGAPLENPTMLCGSMFGLDVRRHRLFETSFPVIQPLCNHGSQAPRFAPATNRKNLRRTVEVGVWRIPLDVQQKAMGIDWMNREELSQAIPPAYSEWLARQWMAADRRAA